ncbi:MAG: hypothetical protein R2755_20895 [Acidimicrobiales bacterium]
MDMAFVLSRRMEVRPWELDAAIEDAVDIAQRYLRSTGLPIVLLRPVAGDVIGALWVTQFAPDLESLAAAQAAFSALSDARAQLNQLWQQRLVGPVEQQLYEVIRGPDFGPGAEGEAPPVPCRFYGVTRARVAMGEIDEALALAIDFAELLEHHAEQRSIVTTAYTGPFVEAVITVGQHSVSHYEETRRRVQLDPTVSTLLKRAAALRATGDQLLLQSIDW